MDSNYSEREQQVQHSKGYLHSHRKEAPLPYTGYDNISEHTAAREHCRE